mgnify:CR=1 FL=1
MTQDVRENPFWDYSLATYEHRGVAELCLQLQDEWGMDVNLVLYAAWLATLQQSLSAAHLDQLSGIVAPWRDGVLRPLREARRAAAGVPDMTHFYDQLKSVELRAEQHQQLLMYQAYLDARPPVEATPSLRQNLNLLAAGDEGCAPLLASLAATLIECQPDLV